MVLEITTVFLKLLKQTGGELINENVTEEMIESMVFNNVPVEKEYEKMKLQKEAELA